MTSMLEGAIRVGVLTVSDRCHQGLAEDTSGPGLVTSVKSMLPCSFKVYIRVFERVSYANFDKPINDK